MKYEEIIELIKKYGENYLGTNTIKKIENICKDSDSMKKQLEEAVTEKWIQRVKELQKILVYEDSIFRNTAIAMRGNVSENHLFPFIICSTQDFKDIKNDKNSQIDIPNLKYYIERTIGQDVINSDLSILDTEIEK